MESKIKKKNQNANKTFYLFSNCFSQQTTQDIKGREKTSLLSLLFKVDI